MLTRTVVYTNRCLCITNCPFRVPAPVPEISKDYYAFKCLLLNKNLKLSGYYSTITESAC